MIYGYIRVSTDKQTVENQRYEIMNFCQKNNLEINTWIEETISGTKKINRRKLGPLLSSMVEGDMLICTELSRLGRSMFMIMEILNNCMESGIKVWTIKDNYRLGGDISSKVLAFAFGLAAEIERDLISKRTKEALQRKRAEGVVLGRPKGRKSTKLKLTGREDEIIEIMSSNNNNKSKTARMLGVNRNTLNKFIDDNKLLKITEL